MGRGILVGITYLKYHIPLLHQHIEMGLLTDPLLRTEPNYIYGKNPNFIHKIHYQYQSRE